MSLRLPCPHIGGSKGFQNLDSMKWTGETQRESAFAVEILTKLLEI
jgi:hypothetical protein